MTSTPLIDHTLRHKNFSDDDIPPVVRILMKEPLPHSADTRSFYSGIRRLMPELIAQAKWTQNNFKYFERERARPNELVAAVSGGLNPLAIDGACQSPMCRVYTAEGLARTLGLYADVVALPDMTTRLLTHSWTARNYDTQLFFNQWFVIKVLSPLIRAGVVRFWSGGIRACAPCSEAIEEMIDDSVRELLGRRKVKATIERDLLSIDATQLFETPLMLNIPLSARHKRMLKSGIKSSVLAHEAFLFAAQISVRSTLIDLKFSEISSATLFTTARQQLRVLNAFDGRAPALSQIALWKSRDRYSFRGLRNFPFRTSSDCGRKRLQRFPRFGRRLCRSWCARTVTWQPPHLQLTA
jgi:hypothetical protein